MVNRNVYTLLLFLLVAACLPAQRVRKIAPVRKPAFDAANRARGLSDTALFDLVQHQTFRYFWEFAHPLSGMARERTNAAYGYGAEVVTTGGTGFGVMAIIVAADRGWIPRDTAAGHLLRMMRFLEKADA